MLYEFEIPGIADTTICRVSGRLSLEGLNAMADAFYKQYCTKFLIVDYEHADFSEVSSDVLKAHMNHHQGSTAQHRQDGVTIHIATSPMVVTMASLYQAVTDTDPDWPVRYVTKLSVADALSYIRDQAR